MQLARVIGDDQQGSIEHRLRDVFGRPEPPVPANVPRQRAAVPSTDMAYAPSAEAALTWRLIT